MARAQGQRRDEFPQSVKDTLGRRVGYLCSRCYISTLGPTTDPHRSSNTGVAAHITAAASGGPRYDTNLTPEERKAATNGIWCCAICGKLVDDDDSRFTETELREIKAIAEHAADVRRDLAQRHASELINAESLSRVAALAILRQWRDTYHYEQSQLVDLDLSESSNSATLPPSLWNITSLIAGLKRQQKLVIRGRPGAGKTMTLLQVAQAMAADNLAPVPLVIAVSAWAETVRDLAGYVEDRLAAHGVDRADVPRLFRMGRLALLLNGWNEAGESQLLRAARLLQEFGMSFPATPILLTTRITESRPAFVGESVFDLRPLSRTKKLALIRAASLANAEDLFGYLTGRPSLDQITDTPLFLTAAIRLARSGITLPETRSGLLQRCIEEVEQNDDHRLALNAAPCHGFHRIYLAAIAATMTRLGRTTLSQTEVQTAIADSSRMLREAGHLSDHGSSSAIADCLVRHHLVVLSPSDDGSHSFVHQQFQERFAADWLLVRIRDLAASNNAEEILRFQQEILDHSTWGEALVFAVEDLVASGLLDAAAALVRWMMPVDLVAAAELAGAGGPALWSRIGTDLSTALRRWHARGGHAHEEGALAGMIATGAPDFSDFIWALLENADEQEFFRALRAYPVFRCSCLGPGWQDRLARLSGSRQEIFFGEMSRQSGIEELEFARRVAVSNAPAAAKNAALELLVRRRHGVEAVALAQNPAFGPWTLETYYAFDQIPLAAMAPLLLRLVQELERESEPAVRRAIIGELRAHGHPQWLEFAQREMTTVAEARRQTSPFQGGTDQRDSRASLVAAYAEWIGAVDSAWLEDWLMTHEANGLLWERPFIERVTTFSEDHLVQLTEAQLREPGDYRAGERVRYVASSGSIRVAEILLNAYLSPAATDRLDRRDLLREVPSAALAIPVVARADGAASWEERVALLKALEYLPNLREGLTVPQQDRLRRLAIEVANSIPADYPQAAHLRATVAAFLGRIGRAEDASQIEALAGTEVARWKEIRRDVAEARRSGRSRQARHDQIGYANFYVGALVALGSAEAEATLIRFLAHPHWLGEAARGLAQLSFREGLLPEQPSAMNRSAGIPQVTPFVPGPVMQTRANAIYAAIEAHRAAGAPSQSNHRPDIVGAAGALALLHDLRAVDFLLGANMQYGGWSVIEHLHVMARHGAVLPGRRILSALEPFIVEGEAPRYGSGQDSWYAIVTGFAMLLASDDPAAVVKRMRGLPSVRLRDYFGRDLFAVLAACPRPEAGEFLVELSRSLPPESASYSDLIDALAASPQPICRSRLLEMAAERGAQSAQSSFRRNFVQLANRDPAFGRALQERLFTLGERERAIFVASLRDLESEEAMLALLDLSDLRPLAQALHDMVREVCFDRIPVKGSGGHHLVPCAVNAVRRKLAGLLLSESADNRAIAASLLAAIQEHRLQYGQPADERLHPDVALISRLGAPWALVD